MRSACVSRCVRSGSFNRAVVRRTLAGNIFSQQHHEVLTQEKTFLGSLPGLLEEVGAAAEDKQLVEEARRQLDELFLLVVVGEFNSGKSTLINALLGQRLLPDGVTPTTSRINIVKYGTAPDAQQDAHYTQQDIVVHRFPVEWLREINIVDTPGTNAVFEQHQLITEHFVPRSDLVLFVTSADRPFSASERTFLQLIRSWNKKLIVVVNKSDILESKDDLNKVIEFVKSNMQQLAGSVTIVPLFPVASRKALRGENDAGFEELRRYVLQSLSGAERAAIKLRSPLGLANKVLRKYGAIVEKRAEVLSNDARSLERMETNLEVWRGEMQKEFKMQQEALRNILLRLETRIYAFLDDTMAFTNLWQLMFSKDQLKGEASLLHTVFFLLYF